MTPEEKAEIKRRLRVAKWEFLACILLSATTVAYAAMQKGAWWGILPVLFAYATMMCALYGRINRKIKAAR